jgi:hypothetical protein
MFQTVSSFSSELQQALEVIRANNFYLLSQMISLAYLMENLPTFIPSIQITGIQFWATSRFFIVRKDSTKVVSS